MNAKDKSVSSLISTRKFWYKNQKTISIFCMIFAGIGILLMMVEIEFVVYNHSHPIEYFSLITFSLKTLVSVFTFLLLVCIVLYHRASLRLFMVENNLNSWRYVLNIPWLLKILMELVVCAVHAPPIPDYNYILTSYRLILGRPDKEYVPIDVIITIFMFLRGYLVFRVLVLHSHIYDHSSKRCVELMQGRNINSKFALKYLLTVYSKTSLVFSIVIVTLWTSWAVRVCEVYEKDSNLNFFNNVWFIGITSLTIGYGDIVPKSICGRFVAVISGVFGVVFTAYVVAIIAESLQLSYSESYLHQFVIDCDLDKRIKLQAAQIIQNFWRLRQAVNSSDPVEADIIKWKLRLMTSKQNMRLLKSEKIQLETRSLRMSTLFYSQHQIHNDVSLMKERISKINNMTTRIVNLLEGKTFSK